MEHINIFKIAAESESFLKVLFTHWKFQVAVSNIKPGESSGLEKWNTETGILTLWGNGHIVVAGEEKAINPGDFVCVSKDTEYKILNLSTQPLKLMVVFAAAVFKDGTDQGSKVSEILDPYKIRR